MSRKRVASSAQDILTGGTRDVNPQYISGRVTLSGTNTATEVIIGTPIVRVGPTTGNTAIIMELLKLWVDPPRVDVEAAAAVVRGTQFSLATASSGTTAVVLFLDNPICIARLSTELTNAFTAAGTGMLQNRNDPSVWDFTDGAGHGILVATDNLFIVAGTVGQNAASFFTWKISYRFKRVSLVEYIGIVQSQQ